MALLIGACATTDSGSDELLVVATTTILGDLVSEVAGDDATVEVIMPIGADPHDFSPSSEDAATMASADLVVANGLGLEEGLEDVLESIDRDGVTVLYVAPLLDPLPFSDHGDHEEDHDEEEEDHEEHTEDPHVWMDPIRMAAAARIVGDELERIAPDQGWLDRAEEYAGELEDTDDVIVELLDGIPQADRKLATNHESLGYFADRYGFEVIGVVIPGGSTLAEPSSAKLAELIDTMIAEDVNVVFAETTEPTALAEAIAGELGQDAQVVELFTGSLGEPGSGAETLIGLLTTDAELIAGALAP